MKDITPDKSTLLKILDEAPIPIGIYEGPELRFVYINKSGAHAIRMEVSEVLGRPYAEVLPLAKERLASVEKVFRTGESFGQKEMPLPLGFDEDGKPITEYVNFLSQAYADNSGKTAGVASFGIMVTEEVLAKQKLSEQSSRTTQILNNLATGFFSLDKNWNFTYSNPASVTALGLQPEEVLGKHVWTLHPQLVGSEFYHAYHRSMNERVVVEVTNYYPEQDRWYHTTSYPLDDGIAVSFSDITVRKKAEEARALSDERFHTLTEAMPQMVWITDADGNADYFNAQWMEKTGTRKEDNYGSGWLNVTHPEDREVAAAAWNDAQTTLSYDVEYRVKMADGSYRWHVARGVPTIGEDKKIKQWVGTTTDIHVQKLAQKELSNAVQSRDDFLSMASHELKTPLTVIQLQGELIRRSLKDATKFDFTSMTRFSSTIERNVHRLTRLVDDMLDISRISTGKLNLETEKVSFKKLVDESVDRMVPLLADAGCELHYSPVEDAIVTVDPFRIEQVMVNLLTNAIRYGKGRPVYVATSLTKNSLIISVKDSGAGISKDDHQRIFDRFERATDTAGKSGLGLGLFIVKNIVDLHRGTISVKSDLGHGAEFIVEIPRLP